MTSDRHRGRSARAPRPGGTDWHRLIVAVLALASLVATGVATSGPAVADTDLAIAVTTTADTVDANDGVTSLREATDQANATWLASTPPGQPPSPTPDTITISLAPSSTYTLDRCGPTTDDEDANATGDLDIMVKPPLTILGHGATVANACPGQRLFHRPYRVLLKTPLTLDHVALTSGQGAPGLAINHLGDLTLRETKVTNSERPSNLSGNRVAAVRLGGSTDGAVVTIERSEISHTTGAAGLSTEGGVGTLTMTDSLISDNANPLPAWNVGSAGVNVDEGTISATITRSTFRRNNLSSSTIPPASWPADLPPEPTNTATGLGAGFAGALYSPSRIPDQFTITDSVFEENQGGRVGGVDGPFSIARSVFRGNVGHAEGGAAVQAAITDSIFDGNLSMFYGAASSPTIRGSTFTNNRTGGVGAAFGVYSSAHPSLIENSTFVDNRSRSGGAIAVPPIGINPPTVVLEIRGTTFARNQAVSSTGGGADIHIGSGRPLPTVKVAGSVLGSATPSPGSPSCSRGNQAGLNSALLSGGGNVFTDSSCVAASDTADTTDAVVADAMIGPVADNGGVTPTAAPLPGSPVRDHIAATDPVCADIAATDQCGQPRRFWGRSVRVRSAPSLGR